MREATVFVYFSSQESILVRNDNRVGLIHSGQVFLAEFINQPCASSTKTLRPYCLECLHHISNSVVNDFKFIPGHVVDFSDQPF